MRITMIGTLPPIKGISEYCIEQVQALSKYISIRFINFKHIYPRMLYPLDPEERDTVFRLKDTSSINIDTRLKWYDIICTIRTGLGIDTKIVHFQWWTSFLFIVFFPLILFAKLRKRKVVCTVHNVVSHESNLVDRLISRTMMLLPDRFIVHSNTNMSQLEQIMNISPSRIEVIPIGSYDFYLDEVISKKDAREFLRIDEKSRVILFFGHIREYKGIDTLIEAVNILKNRIDNFKCIIAGKNWIDWGKYEGMIKNYQLEDFFDLHLRYIPSSEIKYFFFGSDVVVLPYRHFHSQSGAGNVALAFHKALIVSNVGGLPDLVKDRSVIFEPGDHRALAETLLNVLNDSDYLQKLERDSVDISFRNGWDGIARKTIELYKDLLR